MSKKFWDEESESDSDTTMSEQEANKILESVQDSSDEFVEEYEDQELTEDEEVELAEKVLQDANLRLEQGNLYKMLLEHDLFDGVQSSEIAVKNVTREIRSFIRERLEVLVGLKEDPKITKKKKQQDFPFSDIEIQVLKTLLSKSMSAAARTPTPVPSRQEASAPAQPQRPSKVRMVPKQQVRQQAKPQTKPKPQGGLTKHPRDMTREELEAYNKTVSDRQQGKKATPYRRVPPLDQEQINRHYTSMTMSDPAGEGNLAAILLRSSGRSLQKIEDVGDGSGGGEFDPNSRI